MKVKHLTFPYQMKSLDNSGEFSGYLSVFNNVDQGRDVVDPGAFTDSLAQWEKSGDSVPVLWQHQASNPIGAFTKLQEDGKGLYVEGRLLINDVQQAKEAHALAKAKVVRGMSIGYGVDSEKFDGKKNVNHLQKLTLVEGSFATFPMNQQAVIQDIKSVFAKGEAPTIREFEALLRDVTGCSRTEAEDIAVLGYVKFLKQRDVAAKPQSEKSELDRLIERIERLTN